MTRKPSVAFIIPAYNEAAMLPSTLESINRHAAVLGNYEVIVVDNMSGDDTAEIAATMGARVIVSDATTIGANRNLGVQSSNSELFIFLDADITLTAEWSVNAPRVVTNVINNPLLVTGSDCRIGSSSGWVAKTWFDTPLNISGQYIGSAHLIVSKSLFTRLGGFDDTLATGEDYDFCQRARRLGAEIVKEPSLKVLHHGVPRTLGEFLRREMWHGLGDSQSFKAILKSKVAITALIFVGFHIAALLFVLLPVPARYLSLPSLLLILAICLASAVKKLGLKGPVTLLKAGFLYYLYYSGRSLSVLSRFTPGLDISGSRAGRD